MGPVRISKQISCHGHVSGEMMLALLLKGSKLTKRSLLNLIFHSLISNSFGEKSNLPVSIRCNMLAHLCNFCM